MFPSIKEEKITRKLDVCQPYTNLHMLKFRHLYDEVT